MMLGFTIFLCESSYIMTGRDNKEYYKIHQANNYTNML